MAYDFSVQNDGAVTATELVTSVFDAIRQEYSDVLFPEILWKDNIPEGSIAYDVAPGAMSLVYRSRNMKGMGQFLTGTAQNIPNVGQTMGQVSVPILDGVVGSIIMDHDAERYQYGYQSSLVKDSGEVMKLAGERHVERCVFFGDTNANFLPYLDYPLVTKIPSDAWTGTDPRVWVQAISDAIAAVYVDTKTVHLPDTVKLPPTLLSMLTMPFVIGTGATGVATSGLKYLAENNIYSALTNKPLTIESLRYLEGAGVAGADRVIICENKDRNFILPFPLVYQLQQPVPVVLGVHMTARYKFGSFNMPYPASMVYLDVATTEESA